ncbi:MAG: hypothetical protein PGN11_04180 [Quadrisphaera sp.]
MAPTDHRFTDGSRLHLDDDLGPGWRCLLDRARRIWDATEGPFLSRPLHGARTLAALAARPGGLRDVATIAPGTSLRALAQAHLDDPRQRRPGGPDGHLHRLRPAPRAPRRWPRCCTWS